LNPSAEALALGVGQASKSPHLTTRRGGRIPKIGRQHARFFQAAFALFPQTIRHFRSEFAFPCSELEPDYSPGASSEKGDSRLGCFPSRRRNQSLKADRPHSAVPRGDKRDQQDAAAIPHCGYANPSSSDLFPRSAEKLFFLTS